MKKKILLIHPDLLPIPAVGGGAIETLITNLLDENEKQQRVEFFVISKYDEKAEKIKYSFSKIFYFSNNTYINKTKWYKLKWFLYRVWYKLFQNHIIIKLHNKKVTRMNYFVFQSYLIAKKYHIDYLVIEGRDDLLNWVSFTRLLGEKNVFYHSFAAGRKSTEIEKYFSNFIHTSEYCKRVWTQKPGEEEKNILLLNGIDLKLFDIKISYEKKLELRKSLGLQSTDFVVLFCGRIIQLKGVLELVKAFELIGATPHKNIKLLLIGSVCFSAKNESEYSNQVINRAKAMDNVVCTGYIPNSEIPYYQQVSDLQIVPTIGEESAGLVCIEGMMSGLPLIITKSGGMPEYADKKCSVQLPINDELPRNIAEAIIELENSKEKRFEMVKAGKQRAKLFSKEKYYDGFVNIFINN